MGRLKGMTVILIDRVKTGSDGFDRAIYADTEISVDNVLIGEPSSQEMVDTLELTGKRVAYTLGIPKGDTHVWEGRKVRFFGGTYQVIGAPVTGDPDLIPLCWGSKAQVERIE